MNIVVLGNVCIDKNNIEKTFYKKAGGPATFMSLFFNKVKDTKCTTIASYGADFLPYKQGLNLYPGSPNLGNTLVYENTIINGKRSQKCRFYKENITPEIDKNAENVLKNADVLFIAPLIPYFSPEYVKNVVKITSKNCLKILLPQGYFRDFDNSNNVVFKEFKKEREILPLIDIVIVSDEDYPNIENLTLEWSKKYGTTFLITKAQKGAIIISTEVKKTVPTNPIPSKEIVDSIGAGDIFAAAFGYHYFKTKDLEKSVDYANQIAKQKILLKTK
ncbi:MAG: hypothetical protein A3B38_04375 [Candidatus Levybacteria bacterium RIFCSPLOWO2_01_FULL_36_13]|nr:MAG: hypothetical protein A2684_00120 [Candidatus Levybacteria bacterium RIFCSPHIGHO2_01_FULL_36_15b]OGH34065.1 MAG: hypothetical protein A3B38_04375 [Candidatus Levybacteria bacterium RIFCSPLOWO2_01_FULL_36_13]